MVINESGLLAEHIGCLPEQEEAYLCRKDNDAQTEIYSTAVKPLLTLMDEAVGKTLPRIQRTRLIWDGANVWQGAELKDVVLMNPEYEKIVVFKDTVPRMVGNCLYVEGQLAHVFMHKAIPGEVDREKVAQLGKWLWI